MLNNLSFDVLYKSRLAVEENKKNIQKVQEISNNIVENELENENDIDYEYAWKSKRSGVIMLHFL